MALSAWDFILGPLYFIIIMIVANGKKLRNIHQKPYYRFYLPGLAAKLIGSLGVCLIYQLYYEGGDTVNYYESGMSMTKLLFKHPDTYFDVLLNGNTTPENLSYFDMETGWPQYWTDKHSFFMVRITSLFTFLGGGSFVATAMLIAWLSYSGIWKLYELFCQQFEYLHKQMAIAILYIPSVVFWGSGILKDSITIAAVGWFTWAFYFCIIQKRYRFKYILAVILSSYFLLALKPYIFFALIPGSLIWASNDFSKRIHNMYLRFLFTPLLICLGLGGAYLILSSMNEALGLYSLDNVFERAVIVQQDQKQAYYGGNSFDIGDFEPTLPSMLSKTHLALEAAFYRPHIWEARNPVMLLSGLENIYILGLTLFLFIRLKIFGFFKIIFKNPLVQFSVLFALFFGFSVGLSTSNFGSLVRLKIPCIPFFVASLFVIKYMYERDKFNKKFGSKA